MAKQVLPLWAFNDATHKASHGVALGMQQTRYRAWALCSSRLSYIESVGRAYVITATVSSQLCSKVCWSDVYRWPRRYLGYAALCSHSVAWSGVAGRRARLHMSDFVSDGSI
jgi:hypothetical protein